MDVVVLETVVANVMVHVVGLVDLDAQVAVLVEQPSQYIDEREHSTLERWNGEEHYVHRHEGLSVSL